MSVWQIRQSVNTLPVQISPSWHLGAYIKCSRRPSGICQWSCLSFFLACQQLLSLVWNTSLGWMLTCSGHLGFSVAFIPSRRWSLSTWTMGTNSIACPNSLFSAPKIPPSGHCPSPSRTFGGYSTPLPRSQSSQPGLHDDAQLNGGGTDDEHLSSISYFIWVAGDP